MGIWWWYSSGNTNTSSVCKNNLIFRTLIFCHMWGHLESLWSGPWLVLSFEVYVVKHVPRLHFLFLHRLRWQTLCWTLVPNLATCIPVNMSIVSCNLEGTCLKGALRYGIRLRHKYTQYNNRFVQEPGQSFIYLTHRPWSHLNKWQKQLRLRCVWVKTNTIRS